MFTIQKPEKQRIQRFLDAQEGTEFSYPEVGASRSGGPRGYNIDHNRIMIGHGLPDLKRAAEAIRRWKMFDFPWLELCWPDTPIEMGRTVAIIVKHFGFWSMNAARIVYVIDDAEAGRFGFAYGTLSEHGERGEERFMVEIDHTTGDVWYDLFAFSKPNYLMARLGYPLTRLLQKRFAADSGSAMARAVQYEQSSTNIR
jgi:uncharacterized protein (UPF0548 family)